MQKTYILAIALVLACTALAVAYRDSFFSEPETRQATDEEIQGNVEVARTTESLDSVVGDGETEGFSRNAHNSVFTTPDSEWIRRGNLAVQQNYLEGPRPNGYAAHEIVEIDLNGLGNQLRESFEASEAGQSIPVVIPLLEDVIIEIEVYRWRTGEFGLTTARGRVLSDISPASRASFHFNSDGRLDASFRLDAGSFMIVTPSDPPIYAVLDLTGDPEISVID